MKLDNEGKKIGVCMLFAASCFIAAFVLVEFHEFYIAVAIAGILLMISAYLMLTVVLAKKMKEWSKAEEEEEEPPSNGEAEFREQIGTCLERVEACLESIDRTQRAMFSLIKRNLELREADFTELGNAVEKLAAEQAAGVKALVKYNKENARQLAVSGRQSMSEMRKGINENISKNAESLKDAFLEGIEGLVGRAQVFLQAAPVVAEQTETEQIADGLVIDESADGPMIEEAAISVPEAEEEEAEEEKPEETILPEAVAEEEEPEEVVLPEEVKEEPAFDPNAKLSPEDIAKLFASMGS